MANGRSNTGIDSRTTWREENVPAIDIRWNRRLMNESIHAVFKVEYRHCQGTGAFYRAVDKDNCKKSLFITCSHVAPTNNIQDVVDCMTLFYPELGDAKDDSELKFKKEYLLCCWTRKCHCLDATIIELSAEGEKYFGELKITFLEISDAKQNGVVAILQMPEGESKFASGIIDKVEESKVFYKIATAPGSSGAPVLDRNCKAVAIHRAGDVTNADKAKSLADQSDLPRMASLLRDVVNAFFIEYSTLYVVLIMDICCFIHGTIKTTIIWRIINNSN